MHDPREEARRWLDQAENDFAFAHHAMKGEFFHQVCFISQQCSEKAVKALHFADGARDVLGHSVVGLIERLGPRHAHVRALRDTAAELDVYYIPARYPNGLAEGTPHRVFTRSQAERSLAAAESILQAVQGTLS